MYTIELHCTNKKDTLLHHRQRARHVSLLLEPHILRKFRLVQRGGCKTSWNIIYSYIQRLVYALQEENLHSGDLQLKHTTGVRKIINRLFLTIYEEFNMSKRSSAWVRGVQFHFKNHLLDLWILRKSFQNKAWNCGSTQSILSINGIISNLCT